MQTKTSINTPIHCEMPSDVDYGIGDAEMNALVAQLPPAEVRPIEELRAFIAKVYPNLSPLSALPTLLERHAVIHLTFHRARVAASGGDN